MKSQKRFLVSSILVGVLFGAAARLLFGYKPLGSVLGLMSLGFIFGVPTVLGFLTVYWAEREQPLSWGWRIVLPWAASLLALAGALLLGWEGIICIYLWIPLFMILSTLGGLLAVLVRHLGKRSGTQPLVLAFSLLLPFAVAPLEQRFPLPYQERRVAMQIEIAAPVETVWKNIERVPAIAPGEHHFSAFHALGFPRPVEATLAGQGVGAVRHATFEGGLLFIETITRWEQGRRLAFSIRADPKTIPPTTLDEHVTVGGRYFDVLEGEYEIEPAGPGRVVLHLASTHRLSTRFNAYSGLWTDFIMKNVQEYILEIVKRRCEGA